MRRTRSSSATARRKRCSMRCWRRLRQDDEVIVPGAVLGALSRSGAVGGRHAGDRALPAEQRLQTAARTICEAAITRADALAHHQQSGQSFRRGVFAARNCLRSPRCCCSILTIWILADGLYEHIVFDGALRADARRSRAAPEAADADRQRHRQDLRHDGMADRLRGRPGRIDPRDDQDPVADHVRRIVDQPGRRGRRARAARRTCCPNALRSCARGATASPGS